MIHNSRICLFVILCSFFGVASCKQKTQIPEGVVYSVNGVSFTMRPIDGGAYVMGATPEQDDDVLDNATPYHYGKIETYYLGETEVTQGLWEAVMGNNPSVNKGADLPVENVSWDDCQDFIAFLNHLTNMNFRLPTETEWEYAARGGVNLENFYKYSGGNRLNKVAWYDDNSDNKTHTVKTKLPNELGLYDMSGNVWEWCEDLYKEYSCIPLEMEEEINNLQEYAAILNGDYTNAFKSKEKRRVIRGGSKTNNNVCCQVSCRRYHNPEDKTGDIGFRLALSTTSD